VNEKPMNEGRKDDSGKPDLTYLRDVYDAICTVCQVFQFGARKYGRDNWRMVAYDRYDRALLRHVLRNGNDDESGLPHWAHAVACALIYATNKPPVGAVLRMQRHEKDCTLFSNGPCSCRAGAQ